MLKLIALEKRRTKTKAYIISSICVTLSVIVLLVTGASTGYRFDQNLPQVAQDRLIMNHGLLALMFIFFGMAFSITIAMMLTRMVVAEYRGKKAILIFSYPIARTKVFLAKLLYALGVASVFQLLAVYAVIPAVALLIKGETVTVTLTSIFYLSITSLALTFVSFTIGMISILVGFIRKSTMTAIVAVWVIASFVSNSFGYAYGAIMGSPFNALLIAGGALIVTACIFVYMSNQINHLEAV